MVLPTLINIALTAIDATLVSPIYFPELSTSTMGTMLHKDTKNTRKLARPIPNLARLTTNDVENIAIPSTIQIICREITTASIPVVLHLWLTLNSSPLLAPGQMTKLSAYLHEPLHLVIANGI